MIEPQNGYIFIKPVKETKQVGGIDMISMYDEEDRYRKGLVVYACSSTPIKPEHIVLYDFSNGFGFQDGDDLLTVLRAGDVVAIL